MKIKVFYSWESDLPNNKNRGLIEKCLQKVKKSILENNNRIDEFTIESDSRDSIGTPELANTIFRKIDKSDIFIADISIINSGANERPSPNPNVLVELGYAAKAKSWDNVICIYNLEYGKIEDLPFDIRSRKPLTYKTTTEKDVKVNDNLCDILEKEIMAIVENKLLDKKEYSVTKRSVDLGIQSILIDFCQLLYYNDKENKKDRYNYYKLLTSSANEIISILKEKELLGFDLFKNVMLHIKDFIEFFNNGIETYFLSEKEKRLIAKIVLALKEYKRVLYFPNTLIVTGEEKRYIVSSGYNTNPKNGVDSYFLLQPRNNDEAVVIAGGDFQDVDSNALLKIYKIDDHTLEYFGCCIYDIVAFTNEWIKQTGNYFIAKL